jgi:hypothetical protein
MQKSLPRKRTHTGISLALGKQDRARTTPGTAASQFLSPGLAGRQAGSAAVRAQLRSLCANVGRDEGGASGGVAAPAEASPGFSIGAPAPGARARVRTMKTRPIEQSLLDFKGHQERIWFNHRSYREESWRARIVFCSLLHKHVLRAESRFVFAPPLVCSTASCMHRFTNQVVKCFS